MTAASSPAIAASRAPTINEAFRWTSGGGLVALAPLAGYSASVGFGISGDGNVVVGWSDNGGLDQATIWTGSNPATALGYLPGGVVSYAYGTNTDGSVVVGTSEGGTAKAFRWTAGGGMVDIGHLAGDNGAVANGVNGDGSIVVGYSTSGLDEHAFRWTQAGGMVGLGALTSLGDTDSLAAGGGPTDGTVVVGESYNNTDAHAFRWTQATGMQSIASLLTARGVNLTGLSLVDATGVSSNGMRIVGDASDGTDTFAYLADLATGGLTTPAALIASLDSTATAQATQTLGMMSVGLSDALAAANQAFTASNRTGVSAGDPANPYSLYAIGDVGLRQDNIGGAYGLNGTTGILADVTNDLTLGAGVIGSDSRQGLEAGGHATQNAAGGSLLAAYARPEGLRLSGTAFAVLSRRGFRTVDYANGAGTASSHGDTNGVGYAVAGRAGWAFTLTPRNTLTPYGELDWSQAYLGGYTETGGPFPRISAAQMITGSSAASAASRRSKLAPGPGPLCRCGLGSSPVGRGRRPERQRRRIQRYRRPVRR